MWGSVADGFCLFPRQKLLDWPCCSSPVWLAGLRYQLLIFIFSAVFALSSLAISRCHLAKAATPYFFVSFSTASLLVSLGVVLSLQEMLDNCGLFLLIRVASLFSLWLSWTSSYPSMQPDFWHVRPWAGPLTWIPVCSGINVIGPRSGTWWGLWASLQYWRDFQNGFLPNLLLFLFDSAGNVPLVSPRWQFSALLLSCLHFLTRLWTLRWVAQLSQLPPGGGNMVASRVISKWAAASIHGAGRGKRGQIRTWLTDLCRMASFTLSCCLVWNKHWG